MNNIVHDLLENGSINRRDFTEKESIVHPGRLAVTLGWKRYGFHSLWTFLAHEDVGLKIVACACAYELEESLVLVWNVGTHLLQFLGPLDFVSIPKI